MLTSDPENIRKGQMIHEQAKFLRGRFLNFVAVIEYDMAEIITDYFCQKDEDKHELFFNNIASNMSLYQKKKIIINIIKIEAPDYYTKNKEIIDDIQSIQEFRNKLAHSMVDVSETTIDRPLEEGIGFIQWKKGEPITESIFNDWEIRAGQILSMLTDIKRILNLPWNRNA